jgi:hypothetical protein
VSEPEMGDELMEYQELAFDLAASLTDAAWVLIESLADVKGAAEEVVRIDGEYRGSLSDAGMCDRRPDARELATDVVLDSLGCLRPYLPAVSAAGGKRAVDALTSEPPLYAAEEE